MKQRFKKLCSATVTLIEILNNQMFRDVYSTCRGRTAVQFPATSSHMCCVVLVRRVDYMGHLVLLLPTAMP